jgi:hypothetical protein
VILLIALTSLGRGAIAAAAQPGEQPLASGYDDNNQEYLADHLQHRNQ